MQKESSSRGREGRRESLGGGRRRGKEKEIERREIVRAGGREGGREGGRGRERETEREIQRVREGDRDGEKSGIKL